MISLASLRYRDAVNPDLGPISRLECGEFPVFGRRVYQANARLAPGLLPRRRAAAVYSDADGTGAHAVAAIARHIAISEALERWAYYATVRSARAAEFGFDVDASSNGMAAFPGLTRRPARRNAMLEAIERFCLLSWWEDRIDGEVRSTEWPGVSAVAIEGPTGGVAAILFRRTDAGFYAYGHAAAESFTAACEKALTELVRHEWVLRCRLLAHGTLEPGRDVASTLERRSLFFATDAGHGLFMQRLARRASRPQTPVEIVVDREIDGPWSEYACVWRFVLRPPSLRFLDRSDDYFFW